MFHVNNDGRKNDHHFILKWFYLNSVLVSESASALHDLRYATPPVNELIESAPEVTLNSVIFSIP